MDKKSGKDRNNETSMDREDALPRPLEHGEQPEPFDPRRGEDPGALELNEDPREHRLKRHTM